MTANKNNRSNKKPRRKEPIHIRQKALKNGNSSLFLDKYWKGERSYEFLELYLVREITRQDIKQNEATWLIAETIKAERIQDLQKQQAGIPVYKLDYSFMEYFRTLMKARYNSKGTYENWDSTHKHLLIFTKEKDVTFKEVTSEWLTSWKNYLSNATILKSEIKKLKANSRYSYYNKVKAAIRQAHEDGYIPTNPASKIRGMKQGETNRESLTIDEVQLLIKTPCDSILLKRAFLFSVLTGLRWSDVSSIRWLQVQHSSLSGDFIRFNQEKTEQQEFLPISDQARDILGPAKEPTTLVFEGLVYSNSVSTMLSRWMLRAGILKHITFHCARHTHATLLIELDVDIYVLSKLLGHKKITTTEIYAKVSHSKKISATNRIPKLDFKGLQPHGADIVNSENVNLK